MKQPFKKNQGITLPVAALFAATAAISTIVLAQSNDGSDNGNPEQPGTASPTPSPSATPTATASPSGQPGLASTRQTFQATLSPVNSTASGGTGQARVVVEGDRVGVFVQASGLLPSSAHPQYLHLGTACADSSADTNADGYVDVVEAQAVSGPPILPLNLSGGPSSTNLQDFPVSSTSGSYSYIGVFSLSALQSAIGSAPAATPAPTGTSTPGATGTPAASAGPLDGRVIEIQGVNADTQLPSTVQTSEGLPATATLPVACGTLSALNE